MDIIFVAFFLLLTCCLLIGTSKKIKIWFGSIHGVLATVFFVGAQIIKYQTGFYEHSSGSSETLGSWVLPSFIVLGITLLILIEFRLFKTAFQMKSSFKWLLIFLAIFLGIGYLWLGYMSLFFVAFMYFPFAP